MGQVEKKCRIGKVTGKVYPEGTDLSSIGECCIMVKYKNDQELEKEVNKVKVRVLFDCYKCKGCPEYYSVFKY